MSPPDMGCSVVVRIVERKGRKSTAEGFFFAREVVRKIIICPDVTP
jgi:hypothetical protein